MPYLQYILLCLSADVRRVTVIKTIDEFVLIESGEELKAYDNIVLDAQSVTENQLIY